MATKAAEQQRSHLDYLEQLVEGEAAMRENRSIERRIRNARFPVIKTLDDFQWSWPKKINRPQIQNLFRLAFIATQTNIVLIGNVGLGKTHLSIALGHTACLNGHSVLFTTAVDIINTLAAAQSAGRLKREFQRYLKPAILMDDCEFSCRNFATAAVVACCRPKALKSRCPAEWGLFALDRDKNGRSCVTAGQFPVFGAWARTCHRCLRCDTLRIDLQIRDISWECHRS